MTSPPKPTIAILSLGQMGAGIASLLHHHSYRVITNISDRSAATHDRAKSTGIECVATDEKLVSQADYIFSIVPPRDAVATAQRVVSCLEKEGKEETEKEGRRELWYLDLNAISPTTTRSIADLFSNLGNRVKFIDGGIIGGPPAYNTSTQTWTRPGIPLSGPHLPDQKLFNILNARQVGNDIGTASALKCCFAALSKGFTALAIQSFTTASSLGVYSHLQDYLAEYNPGAGEKARNGVVGCTGKAYRWVEEMRQIGECFSQEGGWEDRAGVFREIAGVFEGLAQVVEKEGREGMGDVEGVVGKLGVGMRK